MTLTPTVGHVTQGIRDEFTCYVLDPGNTQLTWLTGLQVLPDNDLVVHHAVVTELDGSKPETQQLVAAKGIGVPFDCGSIATPADVVVHIWTPGNQPMQTDGHLAVPLLANAKLVMQIHYHPAGTVHREDRTALALRTSTVQPERVYFVTAFGNASQAPNLDPDLDDRAGGPEFRIPANAGAHHETMAFTLPALGVDDVRVFSVNPHMHLVGTHISSTIVRANPSSAQPARECLANGGWNFDWQRTYQYATSLATLPQVAEGDTISVECTWNNTRANPFVQRMLDDAGLDAPVDILLGEQTTNEMCLEIVGLSIPTSALLGAQGLTPERLHLPGTRSVAELMKASRWATATRRPRRSRRSR
ncbi:MAG: hypothetical protein H7269_08090 [Cellulomonas sp.]|nr:hypothetical protein [Cellulomonas sp.]